MLVVVIVTVLVQVVDKLDDSVGVADNDADVDDVSVADVLLDAVSDSDADSVPLEVAVRVDDRDGVWVTVCIVVDDEVEVVRLPWESVFNSDLDREKVDDIVDVHVRLGVSELVGVWVMAADMDEVTAADSYGLADGDASALIVGHADTMVVG